MDALLCLRETTHFQSMEFARPEAICGLESGTRSRLWSTGGHRVCRQEVAFFGLRLAGTQIAVMPSGVHHYYVPITFFRIKNSVKVKVKVKINFNGSGQECPSTHAVRWSLAPFGQGEQ
jgi:hypothetical protein